MRTWSTRKPPRCISGQAVWTIVGRASHAETRELSVLIVTTWAFTACFAVWTMFGVTGIPIRTQLNLNSTQLGLLTATPILTGALFRLPLGVWTDRFLGDAYFVVARQFPNQHARSRATAPAQCGAAHRAPRRAGSCCPCPLWSFSKAVKFSIRKSRFSVDFGCRMLAGLERDPRVNENRVVIVCLATQTVNVAGCAIELVPEGVLQPDARVEPRPESWPSVHEWQIGNLT
jgi:hypothetical protein